MSHPIDATGVSLLISTQPDAAIVWVGRSLTASPDVTAAIVQLLARLQANGRAITVNANREVLQHLQLIGWSPDHTNELE